MREMAREHARERLLHLQRAASGPCTEQWADPGEQRCDADRTRPRSPSGSVVAYSSDARSSRSTPATAAPIASAADWITSVEIRPQRRRAMGRAPRVLSPAHLLGRCVGRIVERSVFERVIRHAGRDVLSDRGGRRASCR